MIDSVTKKWIRNHADERAAERGCRFDESRGQLVIDFAKNYLKLYEGDCAGQPLIARDWQIEATMRLFGWVKYSERWGREIRRFNRASVWVPKKNKKSPTLAWWGLYLLCGDGEQGQKVYLAAKDGAQARDIAGRHCIEMVEASPELMAECTINKSLMQITHEATRSILRPISSADSKAQKAKEGLNGSILVDETHVVDAAFMARVSRAGISRSEPLMIEVSTAGNDPESYGRERFDYGLRVESGEVDDDGLFFLAYAAPQDLTDEQLADDPVKYGKKANPAWGHTIGEEEYLADYNQSRGSIQQLADFKMYRLNVWQQSANPWLRMGDWTACQTTFNEADFYGRDCYGGLDLAKTRDTTSLVLCFPEGDGVYSLLAWFWLPEKTAEARARDVSYRDWAKAGWLTLTPGDVCDYNFVRKQINDIRGKFELKTLAFDGTYAEQMMQRLAEEDGMPLESQKKFPQTIMEFAGPTAAFERAVIDHKLRHNGNPLLNWQAGNVRVKTDANANMRPVKQNHGDYRTIDGIVAGIMALAACQDAKAKLFATPQLIII